MKNIKLFTDSSVNPQKKIGFGSFLVVQNENILFENLKESIKTKEFENTSSTKLELETLLWALEEIKNNEDCIIEVYTDCQNIIGLKNRREKLETANNELYKEFFEKIDKMNLVFIKVKGHKKSSLKDEIDTIFNFVDKASRRALRMNITYLK